MPDLLDIHDLHVCMSKAGVDFSKLNYLQKNTFKFVQFYFKLQSVTIISQVILQISEVDL